MVGLSRNPMAAREPPTMATRAIIRPAESAAWSAPTKPSTQRPAATAAVSTANTSASLIDTPKFHDALLAVCLATPRTPTNGLSFRAPRPHCRGSSVEHLPQIRDWNRWGSGRPVPFLQEKYTGLATSREGYENKISLIFGMGRWTRRQLNGMAITKDN